MSNTKSTQPQLSPITISLDHTFGSQSLYEMPRRIDYDDSGYRLQSTHLGIQYSVISNPEYSGGPALEVGYSLISSDADSLGSFRTLTDARVGWRQSALPITAGPISFGVTAAASGNIGSAHNELNFGLGYIPDEEHSIMIGAQGTLGLSIEAPQTGACLTLSGGYNYEQTLTGTPNYFNYGIIAGANLSVRLPKI